MTPKPRMKGLDYSVIEESAGKGPPARALSASVIFGPNASGKTNVLEAMAAFRSIVLRGNLRNPKVPAPGEPSSAWLELLPHRSSSPGSSSAPVSFEISFRAGGVSFEYGFGADLGRFLERGGERRIADERLAVNGKTVFARGRPADGDDRGELEFGDPRLLRELAGADRLPDLGAIKRLARASLVPDELFLTNGFRLLVSRDLASAVLAWLEDDLIVAPREEEAAFAPGEKHRGERAVADKLAGEAAKLFGLNSDAVGYVTGPDGVPRLSSRLSDGEGGCVAVPADVFESAGTTRLAGLLPLIFDALANGRVLAVDDLDRSLHSAALIGIVDLFHNGDINVRGAQLILSAHNLALMDRNLLRRDEIKFTEKDEDGAAELYSLSDFSTTGPRRVRKNENWLKSYMEEKYGAWADVNLSDIAEAVVRSEDAGGEGKSPDGPSAISSHKSS